MSYMDEEGRLRKVIERMKQAREQQRLTESNIGMINQVPTGGTYQTSVTTYTETDLNNAVECENYELAAIIRDQLNNK